MLDYLEWYPVEYYDKEFRKHDDVILWRDDHKKIQKDKGNWENWIGNKDLAYSHFMIIPRCLKGKQELWLDCKFAPENQRLWVETESSFCCWATKSTRDCTGMCVPKGQQIHTRHTHTDWILCDEWGDPLYEADGGLATIVVEYWLYQPKAPDETAVSQG